MNVYIYQAALWCEPCGEAITDKLACKLSTSVTMPRDESTYDSDDFPKGPYANGGGEADAPQHCNGCGVFLQNPLSEAGYELVRDAVLRGTDGSRGAIARECWAPFYGIEVQP